ncbi:MAG: hypothetical protein ACOYD1_13810 [Candidatus Nanopelagicales bacterium]
MTLNQYDCGKRVPYTPNPDGYYYWSSTYYVDSADFSNTAAMTALVTSFEKLITCSNVQMTTWHRKIPPGRGNIVASFSQFLQTGLRPIGTDGYSLLNIARWSLVAASGAKSYKYIRLPLRPIDCTGVLLSSSGFTLQNASLSNFLSTGKFRNQYGSPYVSGSVSPFIHMWQLRHGTKRRERAVVV